jgi:hypothetical protein
MDHHVPHVVGIQYERGKGKNETVSDLSGWEIAPYFY